MLKKAILFILIVLGCSHSSNAQYEQFYKEIGIYGGPVFLKSDFGERGNMDNFTKNNGYTIGIFYYMTFVENFQSLRENFKFRLEASYTKIDLQHYGKYVDNESNSLFTRQLRAMRGSTVMGTLGVQAEYFPFKADDYNRGGSPFSPFFAAGIQVNSYSSEITSTMGRFGEPETTPVKYRDGYKTDEGIAASVSLGGGCRYKLGDYHAIMIEGRLQYFLSDWVDGLNPNNKVYTENKSNEWSTGINLGYIYYIH